MNRNPLSRKFSTNLSRNQSEHPSTTIQITVAISHTRVPGKIIPDRLELNFGDKISTVVFNKKNFARKKIARKTTEPRGTLKPQWNIIPDGAITSYSPYNNPR